MSDHTLFPAKIVTPEGVLFDGEVRQIQVMSDAGGLGILARRSPVVADLKMGRTAIELEDGTWRTWATDEGFAQASNSTATVVVEEAVEASKIDKAHAAELISEGRSRLDTAKTAGDASDQRAASREIAWGEHLTGFEAQS